MDHTRTDILQLQRDVAIARDQQAYKTLFTHFHKSLISFGVSIVRSKEAAEEIYSDIMLKIWDLGPDLANIDDLKVYLVTCARNASLNYLHKYYKIKTVDLDSLDPGMRGGTTPEEDLLTTEFQRTLAKAVNSLPAKSQLVYKLIKEQGFRYKQVAEILGISVNTIEGHMSTALKKLSAALSDYLKSRKR